MKKLRDIGGESVSYLHSACHPRSPTWTKLEREDGRTVRAVVECAECEKHIITLSLDAEG